MSRYFKAKIKANLCLNGKHNLLSLATPEGVSEPFPGQFYMLEANKGYDPLLKRAFSLFRKTSDGFQILYMIKGKGTSILKDMKEGTIIDVLGPLGNPYPVAWENKIPLVIAGGIGIASLFSLIEKLSKRAYVFYGARSKDELFMIDELKNISRELLISTDDGSCAKKGTVIDVLKDFLNSPASLREAGRADFSLLTSSVIYACGPKPMLKELARIAISKDIKTYVSLEENMACGIGACLGCAVRVKNKESEVSPPTHPSPSRGEGKGGGENFEFRSALGGSTEAETPKSELIYKRVCKDGPVFNVEEIVW